MQPSGFEALREHLLRAGVAPRHVRRYVGELRDHFDDLVREETANGASRGAAKIKARTRLGIDSDLAAVMLARPDLRSLTARYPLAVFGLGPIAMVLAALVAGLAAEIGIIKAATALVPHNHSVTLRESFVFAMAIWNSLATYVAPLAIAVALCIVGLRQRMAPKWIFVGIACACFFGALQEISFSDDGLHGELIVASGLVPPFAAGLVVHGLYPIVILYRFVITAALAGAVYWFGVRWRDSGAAEIDKATPHAAE
jgi:hypothetical protein